MRGRGGLLSPCPEAALGQQLPGEVFPTKGGREAKALEGATLYLVPGRQLLDREPTALVYSSVQDLETGPHFTQMVQALCQPAAALWWSPQQHSLCLLIAELQPGGMQMLVE